MHRDLAISYTHYGALLRLLDCGAADCTDSVSEEARAELVIVQQDIEYTHAQVRYFGLRLLGVPSTPLVPPALLRSQL